MESTGRCDISEKNTQLRFRFLLRIYMSIFLITGTSSNPLSAYKSPDDYSAASTKLSISCQYIEDFTKKKIEKICPKGYHELNSTHCILCSNNGFYLDVDNRCRSCLACDKCYPDQPWKNLTTLTECKPDQKGTCQCTNPGMVYDDYFQQCAYPGTSSMTYPDTSSMRMMTSNKATVTPSPPSPPSPPSSTPESSSGYSVPWKHIAISFIGVSLLLSVVLVFACRYIRILLAQLKKNGNNREDGEPEHNYMYTALPNNDVAGQPGAGRCQAAGRKVTRDVYCQVADRDVVEKYDITNGTAVIIVDRQRDHVEEDIKLSTDITKCILGSETQPKIVAASNLENVNSKMDAILSAGDLGDAFVCFLIGHGENDGINDGLILQDDSYYMLDHLKSRLSGSNCPYLVGKPKIIFHTCCRGGATERSVTFVDASGKGGAGVTPTTAENADFLTIYASAHCTTKNDDGNVIEEGKATYFDDKGGQFLLKFNNCIRDLGQKEDLVSILTRANQLGLETVTSKKTGQRVKSQPKFESTLHKPLYLNYRAEETEQVAAAASSMASEQSTSNGTVSHGGS